MGNYVALARKWRPQTFDDFIGQDLVSRALKNALDYNKVHHAFLFTGTRGVGKTTVARLLAKCLCCERGVSSNPCGVCSACRSIADGTYVDMKEVDAASRTKVEETKELLSHAQYAPTAGRYRIFIIDEVHMLSTSSFNALLKTLEEPPEHVKFMLATTDPQKIPITIVSRCLQFPLRRLSMAEITGRMNYILDKENITHDNKALDIISEVADGSMRDALSILDQGIAYGNSVVSVDVVNNMLGRSNVNIIKQLVDEVILKTGNPANTLRKIIELGMDNPGTLNVIIAHLHSHMIQSTQDSDIAAFTIVKEATDTAFWVKSNWSMFPNAMMALESWMLCSLMHRVDGVDIAEAPNIEYKELDELDLVETHASTENSERDNTGTDKPIKSVQNNGQKTTPQVVPDTVTPDAASVVTEQQTSLFG